MEDNSDTNSLYESLEIPKSSTQDEIKRAYRRMAIKYHPDKNPNGADKFKEISHAYEVLGDDRKRRVYDQYGELGLSMMDTVASPLFDPDYYSQMFMALKLISASFILIIIFLTFVTLKIDDYLPWSWAIVWIPAWLVNMIVFYFIYKYYEDISDKESDEEDIYDNNEDDKQQNGSKYRMRQLKQYNKSLRQIKKFIMLFNTLLFLLFQTFVAIRLTGATSWTACLVFIPYFVFEGIHFLITCLNTLVGCLALTSVDEKSKIHIFLFKQHWIAALRFSQFLLIPLRLDSFIECSWAVVFIPLYLAGLKEAVELIYKYIKFSRLPQQEAASSGKIGVILAGILFIVFSLLFYVLIGLIARRLDGTTSVKMSSVFVPLFIVFSFLLCCSGCCLPCWCRKKSKTDEQMAYLVDEISREAQYGGDENSIDAFHSIT